MKGDINDPKALIREAYNIEGITASECRSVFLDWALSLPEELDQKATIALLLAQYSSEEGAESHPMTQVLQDGLETMTNVRRRGGWRGRRNS
ncbi:hypothetical protein KO498_03315 [Lentibacter algarum]|uniref:hypothetical protein n=1 Tax=Lentibacter algarum TaxID=576131 RepID=UPI001C067F8B|nr:hypothetical protein [Lentibacter algarum]MBU2980835.1 hypothetical protein [Lentibacter algarum]